MFLGFGRRSCGIARRIAIRIGGGIGRRRIGLNLSTVVAGFRLGSGAGVCGRLLGFLGEHGRSCQECNKNELFHKILNIPGQNESRILALLHEETAQRIALQELRCACAGWAVDSPRGLGGKLNATGLLIGALLVRRIRIDRAVPLLLLVAFFGVAA
jgi:hypothetical protein